MTKRLSKKHNIVVIANRRDDGDREAAPKETNLTMLKRLLHHRP
ncbi:hypothetical protein [Sphingobacterium olei]|nr:hypothetical protein [Sphingobacterium olei]